jgi:hypothetical protein
MEIQQMCWGSRCDYFTWVPKETSYATIVVNHENVINASITVRQKPLLWTVVYPILQPKILPELYLIPFSVEIHNISAHLGSPYKQVIRYNFLSNIMTKTFYVKYKMMASIKNLQDKLN